ncbi:MAG: YbaK/EbsC family protein [Patescibacteria group bacterium]|jgi:Ala-tRNA(Pro) deacylase
MSISKAVEKYLKNSKIKYQIIPHKTVFTVYDLAQTLKTKLDQVVKTLLVKVDQKYVLVVMPAHYRMDFGKLKKLLKAKKVDIAKEKDMQTKFKTKPGAMTAFGPLHKLEVVADKSLNKTKEALFSAGSFTDSVRLKVKDYIGMVEPTIADIGKKFPIKLQIVKKSKPKKIHHKGKGKPKARKSKRKK